MTYRGILFAIVLVVSGYFAFQWRMEIGDACYKKLGWWAYMRGSEWTYWAGGCGD